MNTAFNGTGSVCNQSQADYQNGSIDCLFQINFQVEFNWQILDEKLYLLATNDVFPMPLVQSALEQTLQMAITKAQQEPFHSIEEAETEPVHLFPDVLKNVNSLCGGYGIEVSDLRFVDYCIDEKDKQLILELEKMQKTAAMMAAAAPAKASETIPAEGFGSTANSPEKVLWICSCGSKNSSNFCSECGSPKSFAKWLCSCGTENQGKFCTECGQKLVEY